MRGEREREILNENTNEKKNKTDYLNKIIYIIDKLMWVFLRSGCVK